MKDIDVLTEGERELLSGPGGPWLTDDYDKMLAVVGRIVLDRIQDERRRAAEMGGLYHDCLDEDIARSIRRDRDYVEAHDRIVRRDALNAAAEAAAEIHCGYDNRHIRSLTAIRKWLTARADEETSA
jgi:hypothetical protein